MRAPILLLALAGACGDNLAPDFLRQLQDTPGVADATEVTTFTPGYAYYVLHFLQPVDHARPNGPTFLQEVSLLHADAAAPLVVYTTGYDDYERDYADELTRFLGGNQVSIEHRFFGTSKPAIPDWSDLTIEQMAGDEHAIIQAFKGVYPGPVLTTGGSKGGMTAIFHRRFFPDDVDGTVAYVAPISFSHADPRYAAFLDTVGPPACRDHIRALAVEMLAHRRDALEQRTLADAHGLGYTRVSLGAAVEAAINDLEWSFWQYRGARFCTNVLPDVTATDDQLWTFLSAVSNPSSNSDQAIARYEAYYYQADTQLGYPDDHTEYLDPYRRYTDAAYATFDPAPTTYDGGEAMRDIDSWVQHDAERLLLVYGGWDPWTGGAYELGGATDSARYTVAEGIHTSNLRLLADADRAAAFARLAAWTGVTPMVTARTSEPPGPRVPSALRRARR